MVDSARRGLLKLSAGGGLVGLVKSLAPGLAQAQPLPPAFVPQGAVGSGSIQDSVGPPVGVPNNHPLRPLLDQSSDDVQVWHETMEGKYDPYVASLQSVSPAMKAHMHRQLSGERKRFMRAIQNKVWG